MYELACFAADKKMKDIWFCTECGSEDKVRKSLELAEALADMRKHTGNEELLLPEYVVYTCLLGYLQRLGAEGAAEKVIPEKRKNAADACNKLAERDASVKAYILKRYGCEKLF
jgi:hypothetical protein